MKNLNLKFKNLPDSTFCRISNINMFNRLKCRYVKIRVHKSEENLSEES